MTFRERPSIERLGPGEFRARPVHRRHVRARIETGARERRLHRGHRGARSISDANHANTLGPAPDRLAPSAPMIQRGRLHLREARHERRAARFDQHVAATRRGSSATSPRVRGPAGTARGARSAARRSRSGKGIDQHLARTRVSSTWYADARRPQCSQSGARSGNKRDGVAMHDAADQHRADVVALVGCRLRRDSPSSANGYSASRDERRVEQRIGGDQRRDARRGRTAEARTERNALASSSSKPCGRPRPRARRISARPAVLRSVLAGEIAHTPATAPSIGDDADLGRVDAPHRGESRRPVDRSGRAGRSPRRCCRRRRERRRWPAWGA